MTRIALTSAHSIQPCQKEIDCSDETNEFDQISLETTHSLNVDV
jgi:cell fate regulator YaaT (PSP1 superfamily)